MTTQPGEQRVSSARLRSRLLILLLSAALLLWLSTTRYPPIREYRLFLVEDRRDANLPWDLVSETWSESEIRKRFSGHPIRCEANYTEASNITRVCAVDLNSLNGVPTMYINFLFAGDKLHRVATAAPMWTHAQALQRLKSVYGAPLVTQARHHSGVRLHGWILQGGGTVFYNRDPELNPFQFNSTQWLGPSACELQSCIQ